MRPPRIPIKVVLPDPDRPPMTRSSPGWASTSTPERIKRRALPAPTCLASPRARIATSLTRGLLVTAPQSNLITLQVSTDEATSAKAFHVSPRHLYSAGAIHDQELVRHHLAVVLTPARLGAGTPITDLDHAIGM